MLPALLARPHARTHTHTHTHKCEYVNNRESDRLEVIVGEYRTKYKLPLPAWKTEELIDKVEANQF